MKAVSDSPAELFDRYVAEVLVTDTSVAASSAFRRQVVPSAGQVLPADDIRLVLGDPTSLFESGQRMGKPDTLLVFALWLGESPAECVPVGWASRAARFRFAVWSLPIRLGRHLYSSDVRVPGGPLQRIDWHRIRQEAWAAQEDWKRHLDAWEDDPWLASAGDKRIETELRWLTTTWPRTNPSRDHTVAWPSPPAPLDLDSDADQRRLAADTAERLVERGSVLRAVSTLAPGAWWRWPLLAGYPILTVAVIVLLATGHADAARWSAVGLLGLGLSVAVAVPTRYVVLGLLRVPAAAAVGLAVLISLTSRWWISANGAWIGLALLVRAALYLALEARQHGARRLAAAGRGLLVTLIGALHAAVLSIAVLGFVVPAMGEHGECLDGWWRHSLWHPLPISISVDGLPSGADSCAKTVRTDRAAAPAGTLVFMTGWSLSFGLAARILWDDRPVTAPLGRLRRVRGGGA